MSSKTLTLDSSTLFLNAHSSTSSQSSAPPLISDKSSLPPVPSDFPVSKIIPKTRFVVDGFRHAGDFSISYFLTHFHSDHYTGLNPNWSKGIIFCSETSARLVIEVLKVASCFVVPLPLSQPVWIDGCEVSLIDANHCPGAVQFLYKIPCNDGKSDRYVHTGDFRYCDSMKLDPLLSESVGADGIFLDTTYCNPKFIFPSQEESIDHIVSVIEKMGVTNDCTKSVLFLVATYVIGKERILLEISRRCNTKIHVDSRKMAILSVLGYGKEEIFTEEESRTNVHVVGWNVLGETWPYFRPNFVKMKEIMDEKGYSKVIGFVPTGWTYEVKNKKFAIRKKGEFEIHLVPYSEHSNYDELRQYVRFLKPKRVIPTVGTDIEKLDSKHAVSMRKHFASLVDEMAVKQEFIMGFSRALQEASDKAEKDSETSKDGKDSGTSSSKRDDELEIVHSPETKTIAGFSPSLQEDGLNELTLLGDKEMEDLTQQVSDCLPTWVTRNQILDLLIISDGNVVEAASHFYEHETEFYEKIISCMSSSAPQNTSPLNQSESLSKPFCLDIPGVNVANPPAQKIIPSCAKVIAKSRASPDKRKRNVDSKPKKKAKTTASREAIDSKQSTITSFFKKPAPKASECAEIGTSPKECSKAKSILSLDPVKPYKDELDQFIKIIDGSDSIRSYAASILEETKGDVNMALDRYYTNPGGDFGENTNSLEDNTRIIRAETIALDCSSQKKKVPSDVSGNLSVLPVAGLSPDAAAVDLVSLAPEKYSPVEHACWRQGVPTPYIHLARTFDLLENEKGKIRATSMLCNMFRSLLVLSPEDVLPAVYLCTNKIAPDHENKELNIGGSIVSAALEEACGTTRSKIKELYDSLGDLGDVAQLCRQTQSLLAPPPPLTIRGVFSSLQRISEQTGSGSNARKKSLIMNLMRSCREKEMKFLVRTLVRNLRIGAMMRTVLPALSQAVVMNSSLHEGTIGSLKEKLQCLSVAIVEAYNILPNLDMLVPCLMNKGIEFSSAALSMVPGIPIKPMLAKISNGIPQVLKIFQNRALTCEYKYDGQRTQIHKLADGSVRVFSRNGDETTSKFPDIVNIIKESCSSASATFIVDAEVVAVDRKNGCKILSFQELASRERGSKDSLITVDRIKVEICLFLFDIMLADGEPLLNVPLRQRRKYLKDLFGDEKLGYLQYARETTVEATDACLDNESTLTRMQSFLDEAVSASCEGLMVKSLDVDAGYSPSKRSEFWLKVKRDYVEGLGDSLDLVPIGAWHGNGRKAGWFSPFLMACYEPDTQEYQRVCRVMSGFSDSFYKEMKEFLSGERVLSKKPMYYQTLEEPDMWFTPELVWEIRGADFTLSPVHKAAVGLVHPSRGISIRFPRFVRSASDRNSDECSTSADVAEIFNSQTRKVDVSIKS